MKNRIVYKPKNILASLTVILFVMTTLLSLGASIYGVCLTGFVLAVLSFVPIFQLPSGSVFETFYRQAWESEAIKKLQDMDNGTWRVGIRDLGRYLQSLNDGETVVINLAYWGVSPDVLVDNTSYPIDIQQLDGDNIVVTVKKYQTKATPITDDELFGLAYDKIRLVQQSHLDKISLEKNDRALHSVAPTANAAATPVIVTTGDVIASEGRRMMRFQDILTFRKLLRKQKYPKGGRLVLCNDHIHDLLSQDEKFKDQYQESADGTVYKRWSFEIFEAITNPIYNTTTLAKTSYGAVPVAGRDFEATVYFNPLAVVQAQGFTKVYASKSENDPLNQRNLINYRHYDIVVPYKQEGIGAIVSAPSV